MTTLSTQADAELTVYRSLQATLSSLREKQQTLLQQSNENSMVLSEMELLGKDDKVFKLVGPVLIGIEEGEAKETVGKRIEFIDSETTKLENSIKQKEASAQTLATKIQKIQAEMQREAKTAAMKAAGGGGGDEE